MNPIGLVLLFGCIAVVFSRSRHVALLGMLAAAVYLPFNQQITIGGINLFAMRFVELAGFIRVASRREFPLSTFNKFDKLFVILFSYTTTVFLLRSSEDLAYRVGVMVDAFLCYFTFRGLVRDSNDLKRLLRAFPLILAPFALCVAIETLTAHNPFEILGKVDPAGYTRNGRQRAFGSFQHPSLVGTLGASFIPLYVAFAYQQINRKIAFIGLFLCLVIVWAADSGAPIGCILFAFVGWLFWGIRTKMKLVRRSIVVLLFALALAMKSPIWYLPAHLSDFTGGDGYHRSYLIDVALHNISKWGLAGMSLQETADWFPTQLAWGVADMTNQYISFGVTAGVIALLLFVALFVKGFSVLGRAMNSIRTLYGSPTEDEFLLWGLGVVLLVHAGNLFGITYYDQMFVIWYLHLATISALSANYTGSPLTASLLSPDPTASVPLR